MNSYDFFIYEFICFMYSYMNSGMPRFQMITVSASSYQTLRSVDQQRRSVPQRLVTQPARARQPASLAA